MADESTMEPFEDPETTAPVVPLTSPEPAPLPPLTTVAEWRRRATARYRMVLPSSFGGEIRTALLKRPDINAMLAEGALQPEDMTQIGAGSAYTTLVRLGRAVAPYAFVEPRVVRAGESIPDDAIGAHEIPEGDLVKMLSWSMGFHEEGVTEVP